MQGMASMDELSDKKKESDAIEIKEQKELQASFGVMSPANVPHVTPLETKTITEEKQLVKPNIEIPPIDIKTNDTEEVQTLKSIIEALSNELEQSNRERDELAIMWRNERTEKSQLEDEYERVESELNHIRGIQFQIGELLKLGTSFDPNVTSTSTLKGLDTKSVTPLSTASTTPGSLLTTISTASATPTKSIVSPTYSTPTRPHL
jgi:hypothetical protein